jgi:hypothetical protein
MLNADVVVWNDLEQWSRKGRTHRAAIMGEQGQQWINIPIKTADKKKAIGKVRIDQDDDWIESFWNALLHNYSNATWFDFFSDDLNADIKQFANFNRLLDLNIWFFGRLMKYLEFKVDYQLASQIPEFDPNPDLFMESMNADVIYQEYDAKNYQWLHDKQVPALKKHPVYKQSEGDFIAGLSILDLIFNEGKESFRVFDQL